MITLVIPTFKRPEFAVRTLRYYAIRRFEGAILVGDSSEGEAAERVRAAAAPLRGAPAVTVLDCRGQDDRETLHRLAQEVATPYVAYIGDDDILLPSGLEQCRQFLERNPDYVAANGDGLAFELRPGNVYGRLRVISRYPQPGLSHVRATERFLAQVHDYRVTLFSLHRTEVWREIWRRSANALDRSFGAELLPCCLLPVLGKVKHLECPYVLRQSHAARYHLPAPDVLMGDPRWLESRHIFVKVIGQGLAQVENLEIAAAQSLVEQAFRDGYMCEKMSPAAQASAPRWRQNLKRVLQRFPVAWAIARRVAFAHRIVAGWPRQTLRRLAQERLSRNELRAWCARSGAAQDEILALIAFLGRGDKAV